MWSDAVKVGVNSIKDSDSHGNPAMWFDRENHIYVTFGGHSGWNGGMQKTSRSNTSASIESWNSSPVFEENCTYPQVHTTPGGEIMVFYRHGRHSISEQTSGPWVYQTSADGGRTWSGKTEVFRKNDGDLYASTAMGSDGVLHVVVVWESMPKIGRQDVYYVYLKDGRWHNQHNTQLPCPMGLSHLNQLDCKIYDTGGDQSTHLPDICLDKDNNVYLGICSAAQSQFLLAKRIGKEPFKVTEIADGCVYWHNSAVIDVISTDEIHAYVNAHGESGKGGRVEQWKSTDGGARWNKAKDVTTFSDAYSLQRVRNYHPDARIAFERASDHTLYLYGDSGFLGRADPYRK